MLNINKVSNNFTEPNFKGEFFNTRCLHHAIESASDYDLYKFSKLLNRMSKVNDDLLFELFADTNSESRRFILCKYKKHHTTKYGVGEEVTDEKSNNMSITVKNILKNINKILEGIYPEPEITSISRETSVRRIMDRLV